VGNDALLVDTKAPEVAVEGAQIRIEFAMYLGVQQGM